MLSYVLVSLLALRTVLASSDICSAYEKYEKRIGCGADGYLLHFGLRNCENFNTNATRELFSTIGKKFIDCTTACLVRHLDDMFKKETPSCSLVTTEAFDSHVDCYLECDFCTVCKTEKAALAHTYYVKDFFNMAALRQVSAVIAHCGVFNCLW